MADETLQSAAGATLDLISQAREAFAPQLAPREIGKVTTVSTGIATVSGLPGVGFEELMKFSGNLFGIAFNVDKEEIGVVLLGDSWHLHAGDEVERTGRVVDVPVGDGLIGRVINPFGAPLDGGNPISFSHRLPIERNAPHIMDRAPVTEPLQTGIKVIDAMIPIGRGQRELILGDRQTGKTTIAIDTILNQIDKNVLCVYCAIGQRGSAVANVVAKLRERNAMAYTTVVVTEGNDAPGMIYIAPYAATSIAEQFMAQGRDVLIVYDDLTNHARSYRELSLLLRRPPGREAYPGDIFYIHSRLLERATHLREELGGGSLTALPIVELPDQSLVRAEYDGINFAALRSFPIRDDGPARLSKTCHESQLHGPVIVVQGAHRRFILADAGSRQCFHGARHRVELSGAGDLVAQAFGGIAHDFSVCWFKPDESIAFLATCNMVSRSALSSLSSAINRLTRSGGNVAAPLRKAASASRIRSTGMLSRMPSFNASSTII